MTTNKATKTTTMKINLKNTELIEETLKSVNGKSISFTITDVDSIRKMLPKRSKVGTKVTYRPAGPSANCYRYKSISTLVKIEKFPSGWFMVDAVRSQVWPKDKQIITIS
jgi:hypothetical protein